LHDSFDQWQTGHFHLNMMIHVIHLSGYQIGKQTLLLEVDPLSRALRAQARQAAIIA